MKQFLLFATLATVACVAILSSCKKDDPVPPVVTITTQPTTPAAVTEGNVAGSLTVTATEDSNDIDFGKETEEV